MCCPSLPILALDIPVESHRCRGALGVVGGVPGLLTTRFHRKPGARRLSAPGDFGSRGMKLAITTGTKV